MRRPEDCWVCWKQYSFPTKPEQVRQLLVQTNGPMLAFQRHVHSQHLKIRPIRPLWKKWRTSTVGNEMTSCMHYRILKPQIKCRQRISFCFTRNNALL